MEIPRRLSVVTFNNVPSQSFAIPPLDALAVPGAEMGAAAARMIVGKLENPDEYLGYSIRIPGRLVRRESAAPAPSA